MVPRSVFQTVVHQNALGPEAYQRAQFRSAKDSRTFVQSLTLHKTLNVHRGCVNTVAWNESGQFILSGSDDQTIAITNPFTGKKIIQHVTGHRANIFSAKFMPQSNDQGVVSCSGDGAVLYTNLAAPTTNPDQLHMFNCHSNTTYEVLPLPYDPSSFLSCGEDSSVRMFDLRTASRCQKTNCRDNILIQGPTALTAMCLSPTLDQLVAVGSADSQVRIYDRRCLRNVTTKGYSVPVKCFSIPSAEKRPFRVTSVCYGPGDQLLVNYSSDHLYLFDANAQGEDVAKCFKAPQNQGSEEAMEETATAGNSSRTRGGTSTANDSSWLRPRRLRLRGDWSDTGPEARPEGDYSNTGSSGQARPMLQAPIMDHMTEILSRMLADPRTRENLNLLNRLGREAANSTLNAPESGSREEASAPGQQEQQQRQEQLEEEQPHQEEAEEEMREDESVPDRVQQHSDNSRQEEVADQSAAAAEPVQCDYLIQKFMGHRNARTMIKEASFWGDDYIMSGSDCGHVFTWDKRTGEVVMLMEADHHVVNSVQPHPTMPYLATSGIDYNVKLWAPTLDLGDDEDVVVRFDKQKARELMERNAVMLEETKDTITVPASVMIRMLACIHTFRNRRTLNDFARISGGNRN